MELWVREATSADGEYVADHMRQGDADEAWALGHLSPRDAVRLSMVGSREPVCATIDGRPILVAGVAQVSILGHQDVGYPWMACTDGVDRYGRKFLKAGKAYTDAALQEYGRLENYVDCRNEKAIKWLGWMGFTLDPPAPFGLDRLPFRKFHMEIT